MKNKVSIIIPTLNEEKYIGKTIQRIKKVGNYEIIVVDKSDDNTGKIARKLGAKVIRQTNSGKGNAMRLGVKYAKGEILIFVDGDNSYEVEKIPKMISLLDKNDIVYGQRIFESQPFIRLIGDKLATELMRIKGYKTKDLLTGLYALRKKDFVKLKTKENKFGIETEIFIKVNKLNFKIGWVPIKYHNRKNSKLNIKDAIRILSLILFS